MRRKETAIEVKVGALVLLAIAVFAAFLIILGDCNFNPGFTVKIEFANAAGLKPGAPIRLSGIPAGSVKSVTYEAGERPVKVVAWIEDSIKDSIRADATFTITTQGVLGEPYVEITSLDASLPPIEAGGTYIGTDPPRMDQLLSSAYKGIEGIRELVERLNRRGENIIRIDDFINNIADLAGNIDERVVANKDHIDQIIANLDAVIDEVENNKQTIPGILTNVESATHEFNQLGQSLNRGVGDGSKIRSILSNVDDVSEVAAREAGPTLENIRSAAETANRVLTENEDGIQETVDNAAAATGSVRNIITRIENGEGSIGRILRDEEIYEDMREFVRELKRRPWRIIWKE